MFDNIKNINQFFIISIVRTYISNERMFARAASENAKNYTGTYSYIPRDKRTSRESTLTSDGTQIDTTYTFLTDTSGTWEEFKRYTQFDTIGDRERAIILLPQAATEFFNGNLEINWDSEVQGLNIDDVGFLTRVLDEVESLYTPNLDRIYTTGFSNGAWMTVVLACALNDRIDGFAPVAGLLPLSRIPCLGEKKVPIIYTYGTQDLEDIPSVIQDNLDYFAGELECANTQSETLLPDTSPEDMTTVTHIVRDGCPLGVGLEYYRVNNGTHTWPGSSLLRSPTANQDINTSQIIWDFFEAKYNEGK